MELIIKIDIIEPSGDDTYLLNMRTGVDHRGLNNLFWVEHEDHNYIIFFSLYKFTPNSMIQAHVA